MHSPFLIITPSTHPHTSSRSAALTAAWTVPCFAAFAERQPRERRTNYTPRDFTEAYTCVHGNLGTNRLVGAGVGGCALLLSASRLHQPIHPSRQRHSIVWDMATQRAPFNFAEDLYGGYQDVSTWTGKKRAIVLWVSLLSPFSRGWVWWGVPDREGRGSLFSLVGGMECGGGRPCRVRLFSFSLSFVGGCGGGSDRQERGEAYGRLSLSRGWSVMGGNTARRCFAWSCLHKRKRRDAHRPSILPPPPPTHVTQSLARFAREEALPGLEQSASDDRALLLEFCCRWLQHHALTRDYLRAFVILVRRVIPPQTPKRPYLALLPSWIY